ncbi:MAG TPA: aminoglycoside phosphotransferase family protein [Mucilaginibacter sp.]|jgi:Ser/Thr protein kinase RdoA (MazF antagonist)|nr:aminoglycoside phosphotransferase family protein [Mucilaginibacter sp.]
MIQIKEQVDLLTIVSNFQIAADPIFIQPFGSGHINDTYYIKNNHSGEPDYLLQRVNHLVFKDVPALINNIVLVTSHLRAKLGGIPSADPCKEVLTLIKTNDYRYFHQDENGNFWRVYKYIENTRSIDIVETNDLAFEGGRALAKFQTLLFDLDANLLTDTIPDFHNISMRLTRFNTALVNDPLCRKASVVNEIEFIQKRVQKMCAILELGKKRKLPLRITHNDTKFNNILLDEQGRAQCIIDLDTVMPGYIAYDFGDAIRTIINTAAEDEKDLKKIGLNMPLFQAFTQGYMKESAAFLTEDEIQSLPMAVLLFPYMQGLRFLTDYLNGDTYYKINFPSHNLQRTRSQLQLFRLLEERYAEIEMIIFNEANLYLTDNNK